MQFLTELMIYKAFRFDDIPQQVADDIHALWRDWGSRPKYQPKFNQLFFSFSCTARISMLN